MNNSRNLLRINVGFILSQPRGTHRDFQLDIPEFELSQDQIAHNLNGVVRISRTSEGLLVQAEFKTQVNAACSRCLDEFEQRLKTDFSELYAFPKHQPYELDEEDTPELVLPIDGYIDLAPLLQEYLLLEIPISSLCRKDCKGLCLHCGANLNQNACGHSVNTAAFIPQQPGS